MSDHIDETTRIVITGLGVVSSAGRTTDQFWQTLTSDRPLGPAASDAADCGMARRVGVADFSGHIKDFGDLPDAKRKFIRKALKLMNRETQMGVAVGQQALCESGAVEHYAADRFGVCFGADNVSVMPEDFERGIQACSSTENGFDFDRWGTEGIEQIAPLWILKCLPNMAACHLAIINDLQGPSNTITQRDVSANIAIAEACRGIRAGDTDAALVGATGTTLSPFNHIHAQLEGEILDGNTVCRPFDKRRVGAVPGEGAGAVVLEKLDSAVRRGAHIYGEIRGWGSATVIDTDGTANCRKAISATLRQALRHAGMTPGEVGHIHAHGLGTWESDIAEAQAIREVFGDAKSDLPVVAAKSHLANTAAGAGALELIASLLALKHGHLFPVLNYEVPDSACPIHAVADCRESSGKSFLNVNVFGRGLASCVAVAAYAA